MSPRSPSPSRGRPSGSSRSSLASGHASARRSCSPRARTPRSPRPRRRTCSASPNGRSPHSCTGGWTGRMSLSGSRPSSSRSSTRRCARDGRKGRGGYIRASPPHPPGAAEAARGTGRAREPTRPRAGPPGPIGPPYARGNSRKPRQTYFRQSECRPVADRRAGGFVGHLPPPNAARANDAPDVANQRDRVGAAPRSGPHRSPSKFSRPRLAFPKLAATPVATPGRKPAGERSMTMTKKTNAKKTTRKPAAKATPKAAAKKAPAMLASAARAEGAAKTKRAVAAKGDASAAPANKRTAKPKEPTSAPKRISALDAAAQVLAASTEPMRAKDLIAAMAEQGLWSSPSGKTPEATLYAAMIREIAAKGSDARFRKIERGLFAAGATRKGS
ncbi:MAG: hypothetical protein C0468_02900 [Planctomyces sp.]|nr:hypothetical protein [Planctomyces sp.]MBA4119686.1 hypothetical protein [Isosphaera sp.]